MTPPKAPHDPAPGFSGSVVREDTIDYGFIGTLQKLKYEYRPDIRDRAARGVNHLKEHDPHTSEEFNRLQQT